MGQKAVSRSSLYNDSDEVEYDSSEEYVPPQLDFEFIEVDYEQGGKTEEEEEAQGKEKEGVEEEEEAQGKEKEGVEEEKDEEFEFPLFASAASSSISNTSEDEVRGRRSTSKHTQKISLRDHSEERINSKRPESFYFAKYSPKEKQQFEYCAVTWEEMRDQSYICPNSRRCLNLQEHNANIDKELVQLKAKKSKRPGKRKRENKIHCRERREERAKLLKKEEKRRIAKEKQNKYGRFGFNKYGARASKKSFNKSPKYHREAVTGRASLTKVVAKPKYRTE